jgi:hypothetical protein
MSIVLRVKELPPVRSYIRMLVVSEQRDFLKTIQTVARHALIRMLQHILAVHE